MEFWGTIATFFLFSLSSVGSFLISPVSAKSPPWAVTTNISQKREQWQIGDLPYSSLSRCLMISNPRTHAIVRLKDLELPRPQVSGAETLPLYLLSGGLLWTLDFQVGTVSGRFLVDTGAVTTMVGSPLIQKLGLQGTSISRDRLDYAVAGNSCPNFQAILHRLPTLKNKSINIDNLSVLELANTAIPNDISGVFGMDLLSKFDVIIDPTQANIQLLPPSELPTKQRNNAIPLQGKLGVMLAQVEINGKGPFTFLLDTGAESIFMSPQVAQKLALTPPQMKDINVEGFCGLESAKLTQLAEVKLGEKKLNKLEVIILDSSILKFLEIDGILGQNFLNKFKQHWRFEQNKNGKIPQQGTLILYSL